jgi:serine/threonine protein kinase
VHRDLKPANILLTRTSTKSNRLRLALHLMTTGGRPEIAGTLAYMAPEQASGETHRLDARTDLWAVGVILYRMLSGQLPFSGTTNQELLEAIRYGESRDPRSIDPQISPELARIVRRCLAKRMSERYQSAAELADDQVIESAGSSARKGSKRVARCSRTRGAARFGTNDRDFSSHSFHQDRRRAVGSALLGTPSAELDPHEAFRVGLLYGQWLRKIIIDPCGILPCRGMLRYWSLKVFVTRQN